METWVGECRAYRNWEPTTDPRVKKHVGTGGKITFKKQLCARVQAKRTVVLGADKRLDTDTLMTMSKTDITLAPELKNIPETLWAKGKYDVGLVKSAQPVVVNPKSSYRPCAHQYPLKQEAIDGITTVFNSLLKAGVIVPCRMQGLVMFTAVVR